MKMDETELLYWAKFKLLTGVEWDPETMKYPGNFLQILNQHATMVDIGRYPYPYMQEIGGLKTIRDWCQEKFGDNWLANWYAFYFKNPEDATFFSLRWQ